MNFKKIEYLVYCWNLYKSGDISNNRIDISTKLFSPHMLRCNIKLKKAFYNQVMINYMEWLTWLRMKTYALVMSIFSYIFSWTRLTNILLLVPKYFRPLKSFMAHTI